MNFELYAARFAFHYIIQLLPKAFFRYVDISSLSHLYLSHYCLLVNKNNYPLFFWCLSLRWSCRLSYCTEQASLQGWVKHRQTDKITKITGQNLQLT